MPGTGRLEGPLRRFWLSGLLLAVVFAGWEWGPAVFRGMQGWLAEEEEVVEVLPSPELADAALDRFARFRRGEMGAQLSLSATDVVSVIRYSATGLLPDGVSDPDVEFRDGRVILKCARLGRRLSQVAYPGWRIGLPPRHGFHVARGRPRAAR